MQTLHICVFVFHDVTDTITEEILLVEYQCERENSLYQLSVVDNNKNMPIVVTSNTIFKFATNL